MGKGENTKRTVLGMKIKMRKNVGWGKAYIGNKKKKSGGVIVKSMDQTQGRRRRRRKREEQKHVKFSQ